jgi:hypothetical protein
MLIFEADTQPHMEPRAHRTKTLPQTNQECRGKIQDIYQRAHDSSTGVIHPCFQRQRSPH